MKRNFLGWTFEFGLMVVQNGPWAEQTRAILTPTLLVELQRELSPTGELYLLLPSLGSIKIRKKGIHCYLITESPS